MPRFFFHIHQNGELHKDSVGTELATLDAVRIEAMATLPEIAKDEVPNYGDRQAFTIMVTDKSGNPVYSATLSFAGLWLT